MAKVQATMEMDWLDEFVRDFRLPPELQNAAYKRMVAHFYPAVQQSAPSARAEAIEIIKGILETLEDGVEVDMPTLVQRGGLNPNWQSDGTFVREYVKSTGQVEFQKSQPAKWVKRITHQNNDSTAH